MIKIALAGAGGKMGSIIARCVRKTHDFTLVAAIESANHPSLGQDIGVLAGTGNMGVPLVSEHTGIENADVVIDFTFHTAVPFNVNSALKFHKPMVIGTTGLTNEEKDIVIEATKQIPIVWAPNMSLGVNLLFAMVRRAASVLGFEYKIDIDETHHIHKKDAPSGTALRLAEKAAEGRSQKAENSIVFDKDGTTIRRPDNMDKIIIRSHRRGEVVGDHTVSFDNDVETIEFTHHAWNREAFAMGALHAAKWVIKQNPGLYDMQSVLGL